MDDVQPFRLIGGTVVLGSNVVLHEVDFHLESGEFLVLLGANGSGKTTLIKSLLGLLPLSAGRLFVFGKELRDFGDWNSIGYVPQRFTAAAGVPATIEEVVLSGRVGRGSGWKRYGKDDVAHAQRALADAGLSGKEKRSIAELSGGQQQRVLIARALAADPSVLVLDEPVSGVDLESQGSFARTLETLKGRGRSVLLVAHSLGAMEPLVDRAIALEGGHVVYDGPPLAEHVLSGQHHHPSHHHHGRQIDGAKH